MTTEMTCLASGGGVQIEAEDFANVSTTGANRTLPTTKDFSGYDHVFVELSSKPYSTFGGVAVVAKSSSSLTIALIGTDGEASMSYTISGTIYAFND